MRPMERVVYILGAGFSAPLGLPVMGNFLSMSRDMFYGTDGDRYRHFNKVFERIGQMHVSKGFFNVDLTNIEEVLSILEMETSMEGGKTQSLFLLPWLAQE